MHVLPSLLPKIAATTIWLVLLAIIFVPLERWFELRAERRPRDTWSRDIGLYFFNSIIPALLLSLPISAVVAVTHRLLPPGYLAALNALPLALQLTLTFVVGEFGFYWGHRWSHEWPLLWRFHAMHHRPERLDWLVNTYAHPIDMVFGRLCGLVPLYLLGLAGRGAGNGNLLAVLFTIVGTGWSFFIHANVRWRLRWIDRLIATPRFHHWHHVREGPINRNYASMLPLMDRLFGTLHMPGRDWPASYGVAEAEPATPTPAREREPA